MPTARYSMAAAAGPDGRIYVMGGYVCGGGYLGPTQTLEAYSPATNTWIAVAGMHEPRYAPAATVGADGRIYVIGGSGSPATALASVEAYDPATNTWTELAPLRIPRELAGAAAVGTQIYVAGGINVHRGPGGGTGVLSDVETYLPACRYVFGFQALHDQLSSLVGDCTSDESHNPANGDALQHTTNGLLVWRKADNFTAFTDGYRTWVNGPYGVQERLNTERFPWEASPV